MPQPKEFNYKPIDRTRAESLRVFEASLRNDGRFMDAVAKSELGTAARALSEWLDRNNPIDKHNLAEAQAVAEPILTEHGLGEEARELFWKQYAVVMGNPNIFRPNIEDETERGGQ